MGDLCEQVDVAVIGGGPGGYVAAIRAAQLGKSVVLVDSGGLGGVCLQQGCIPSKALITAANLYHKIPSLSAMGITCKDLKLDPKRLFLWKDSVVDGLTKGIEKLCRNYGVNYINGTARFEGSRKIKVIGAGNFEFADAIIATGSTQAGIPSAPIDHKTIIDSTDLLSLKAVPKTLAIIGGGYIGMELGMAFAKLGSSVTVIESSARILSGVDSDLVGPVMDSAKKLGMTVLLSTKEEKVSKMKGSVSIDFYGADEKKDTLNASHLLVCVGRRPNTADLGLENTAVSLDEKGFIKVDVQMRTSDLHIYAVGDVTGNPMLAHRASRQGKVAAEAVAGMNSAFDNRAMPYVVFTSPEIASAGMSGDEAQARGIESASAQFPLIALGRAHTTMETEGFVKIITEKESGVVLGVHIVGEHASDMISEAALALEMGATADDIALTIHPHPTFPESLMQAADAVQRKSTDIYIPK